MDGLRLGLILRTAWLLHGGACVHRTEEMIEYSSLVRASVNYASDDVKKTCMYTEDSMRGVGCDVLH
jgi:hypothetical protein